MSTVAAIQMTSGHARRGKPRGGGQAVARGEGCGRGTCLSAREFLLHRSQGCRQARRGGSRRRGTGSAVPERTARALGLWILGGTTVIKGDSARRVSNTSLLFDAQGKRVARYDKIHLFDVAIPGRNEQYLESTHVTPGRKVVVADTPVGRLGLSVCYDMRFPELYRELVARGAEWLAMPAAFTVPTGRAHWETLLRARAIENLCYVVAPGAMGHAHERPRNLWRHIDRRLLGSGAVAPAERDRRDHGAIRSWRARRRRGRAFRRSRIAGSACAPKRRCRHERRRASLGCGAEDDPGAFGIGREPSRDACSVPS